MVFLAVVGLGLQGLQMALSADANKDAFKADLKRQVNTQYTKTFNNEMRNINLRKAQHASQLNISAAHQDKVLSDTDIKMRQEKAKALIEVGAAASGVSGASVNSAIYNTERSAAFASNNNKRKTEQATESLFADVGNKQAAMLEVEEFEVDMSKQPNIYDTLAQIDQTTLDNLGTIGEGIWG